LKKILANVSGEKNICQLTVSRTFAKQNLWKWKDRLVQSQNEKEMFESENTTK
jgi:hypothetical protein